MLFREKNGFLSSFVVILLIKNQVLKTHVLECSSLSGVYVSSAHDSHKTTFPKVDSQHDQIIIIINPSYPFTWEFEEEDKHSLEKQIKSNNILLGPAFDR